MNRSPRRATRLFAAIAVTAAAVATTAASAAESIKLALTPGSAAITQRMTMVEKSTQTVMGQTMSGTETTVFEFKTEFVARTPEKGAFAVRTTLTRAAVKSDGGGAMPFEVDSSKPATLGSPMAAQFKSLLDIVGTPLDYEVDRKGRIVAGDALKKIRLVEGEEIGGSLYSIMSGFIVAVPESAVGAGDSWKRTLSKDEVGLPTDVEVKYTLESAKGGAWSVGRTSQLVIEDLEMEMQPGVSMTMNMKGDGTATDTFDAATGWIRTMKETQKIAGTVTAEMAPGQNLEVPISVEITTTLETIGG